jgi:hypothetical protein
MIIESTHKQEPQMFINNVHGKEVINNKAAAIGCQAGLCGSDWAAKPGLVGNTFKIKDQLKQAGARWNGTVKAWSFADWAALEAALDTIVSV